jgi:hypothetical protein
MSVKALFKRVSKLEPKPSKILLNIGGSLEKFEAEIQAGIDDGRYCADDMAVIVKVIRKWTSM